MASRKAVLNAEAKLLAATARVKKAEADLTKAKANVQVAKASRRRPTSWSDIPESLLRTMA